MYPEKTCRRCGITKTWFDFARKSNVCNRCKKVKRKPVSIKSAATEKQSNKRTITMDDVILIRKLCEEYKEAKTKFDELTRAIGPRALGEKFGITHDHVGKIARRAIWK